MLSRLFLFVFIFFSGNTLFSQIVTSCRLTAAHDIEMPTLEAYPIFATVTDATYSITSVEFKMDDVVMSAQYIGSNYELWWTPDSYGTHELVITSSNDNGDTDVFNAVVNVVSSASNQTVPVFQDVVVDFGSTAREFEAEYELPQSVGAYDMITANLDISCPAVSGGCDDYDRYATIRVLDPNGDWVEIIRYITPFGVGCNHTIEVTDFDFVLQGKVKFKVFIDTWGTGGWNVNLSLDYQVGTPDYKYNYVVPFWTANYPFGNPANLQPVEQYSHTFSSNTLAAKLKLMSTGHGWGQNNTSNAAEFYAAVHHVHVDGSSTFTQALSQTCDPNPDGCQPQNGTWTYARAGWCPGAISHGDDYSLDSYISSGTILLDYVFQESYVDYCHPNHPDCISGTTCPDCDAGYNPQYYVQANLILGSNEAEPVLPLSTMQHDLFSNVSVELVANPIKEGMLLLKSTENLNEIGVSVVSVSGASLKNYFFKDTEALNTTCLDVSHLASGTYFVRILAREGNAALKFIVE